MGKPMSQKQVPVEGNAGLGSTKGEERREGRSTSVSPGAQMRETKEKKKKGGGCIID